MTNEYDGAKRNPHTGEIIRDQDYQPPRRDDPSRNGTRECPDSHVFHDSDSRMRNGGQLWEQIPNTAGLIPIDLKEHDRLLLREFVSDVMNEPDSWFRIIDRFLKERNAP